MMLRIGRLLSRGTSDPSPGGTANGFLQEDGIFGFLLEDGSSDLLMEA